MIVDMRTAISEIFSMICSNVDQILPVVVVGVTRRLVMRSTHFTIVWSTCLVHWPIVLLMLLRPEALSSSSSSSSCAWVRSQDICALGAIVVAEVNALFIDPVADRKVLVPAVVQVMVVLRTDIVREETLLFRDWVDNQPYLAPDIMIKTTTPNAHPVREETLNTVDCMVVQAPLAQLMRVVDLVISSLITHDVHSEKMTFMDGIRSLNMRRGSKMTNITRIGTSQP